MGLVDLPSTIYHLTWMNENLRKHLPFGTCVSDSVGSWELDKYLGWIPADNSHFIVKFEYWNQTYQTSRFALLTFGTYTLLWLWTLNNKQASLCQVSRHPVSLPEYTSYTLSEYKYIQRLCAIVRVKRGGWLLLCHPCIIYINVSVIKV